MKRLIRVIGGKASAGEKDEQLRAMAMRRLNLALDEDRQITDRRARTYWHGEMEDIPSDHMDRARELAFVQPIQEAEDAITNAELFLEGLRARLAGSVGTPVRRIGSSATSRGEGLRAAGESGGRSRISRMDAALTVARAGV